MIQVFAEQMQVVVEFRFAFFALLHRHLNKHQQHQRQFQQFKQHNNNNNQQHLLVLIDSLQRKQIAKTTTIQAALIVKVRL